MKGLKYYFYLNPHDEYKWTKCPKCDTQTKVRKICLAGHYEEKMQKFNRILLINKSCKLCVSCQLVIVQKSEIEAFLEESISKLGVKFNSKNYLIFGTLDKADWGKNKKKPFTEREILKKSYRFKDIWDFEIQPAGWYYEGE